MTVGDVIALFVMLAGGDGEFEAGPYPRDSPDRRI